MKLYGSKRNWNFLEDYRTKQNGTTSSPKAAKKKAEYKKLAHRTARRTAKIEI